jgi:hypothetical protein
MNISLFIDDKLVQEVRRIAAERGTTLTGLVRNYLTQLTAENSRSGRIRREKEALERTFQKFQFSVGKRTRTRAELHERS